MSAAVRAAAWGTVVALLGAGCQDVDPTVGYSSQSLYRSDIRTVRVPIFQSRDFRRDLEFRLTEAIIKQIESATPYKVVDDRSRADTELTGEVHQVSQSVLANEYNTDLPQELHLVMSVSLAWKDLRSGELLVRRDRFQQSAEYLPLAGESFQQGSQIAIDRIAATIVEQLEADW